jgi:hypothetical protein
MELSKLFEPLAKVLTETKVTAGIALACALLWFLNAKRLLPITMEAKWVFAVIAVGLVCACITVTSLVSSLWKATEGLRGSVTTGISRHNEKKKFEKELSFLTPEERNILAYLLTKNTKVFPATPDGEYAASLIAKGFVVLSSKRPPVIQRDVTFEIPAHVWSVLDKHRNEFAYKPKSGHEVQPWRIPWMAR